MTSHRLRPVLAAALFAVAIAALAASFPPPHPTRHAGVRFSSPGPLAGWLIDAEVATSESEHQRGLQWRSALAASAGMLFVFDKSADQSFWMFNTLLPLDMVFLDEDQVVVGVVEHALSGDLTPRTIGKPSSYVLEVAAGEASAHGVRLGSRADFTDMKK